jgi:hypothetical protein
MKKEAWRLEFERNFCVDPTLEFTDKIIDSSGEWYCGQCRKLANGSCVKQGYGIETWLNNDVYEGYWDEGQIVRGKYTKAASAQEYNGEFKDGKAHGFGLWVDLID